MRVERVAQCEMLARLDGWTNKREGRAELVYCVLQVCYHDPIHVSLMPMKQRHKP